MKKIFVLLALVLSFLTGCTKESASVGVIGGADGPTSVMVSGPVLPMALVVLGIIVVVAIIIVFVTHRKD
ncbi:MAG: sodium ion-translocating decarboxylase subunit beta [Clostridia bacterium]|nr:sodium ion-translocating decarboxylase subunit beta [Clostridia bacterium]